MAASHDIAAIRALLSEAGLIHRDLTDAMLADVDVVRAQGAIVGVAGFERHGDYGLLRSVAVADAWRGRGLARVLVDAVERRLGGAGVRSIFLLTTGAAPVFERLGYAALARDAAPEAIRGTTQFAGLCPASSSLMRKTLAP